MRNQNRLDEAGFTIEKEYCIIYEIDMPYE